MNLLQSTKSRLTKDKNEENVTRLEITEVALIHCNIVNNSYQQNSRVLYRFVPNKSSGQLLNISPENFIFLKTFDSEFHCACIQSEYRKTWTRNNSVFGHFSRSERLSHTTNRALSICIKKAIGICCQ